MQKTEKELKDTIMEDSSQEAITERNRSEAITMAQTECPATDFYSRPMPNLFWNDFYAG